MMNSLDTMANYLTKSMPHLYKIVFCSLILLMSSVALSQSKKITILETMDVPIVTETTKAFIQSVQTTPENQTYDLTFEVLKAQGSFESAKQLVEEILTAKEKPDLIVAVATLATRALVQSPIKHDIPMQFMVIADPVGENIVDEIGQNSRINITGQPHAIPAKAKLEVMLKILGDKATKEHPYRIALLASDYPSSQSIVQNLLTAQSNFPEIKFLPTRFSYIAGKEGRKAMRAEALSALTAISEEVDAYWMPSGPFGYAPKLQADIQQELAIPKIFSPEIDSVKDGAVIGVTASPKTIGHAAASITTKILSGSPANQIPVTRPTEFVIAVNLTSAIKYDLVIPSDILSLAKQHIYR